MLLYSQLCSLEWWLWTWRLLTILLSCSCMLVRCRCCKQPASHNKPLVEHRHPQAGYQHKSPTFFRSLIQFQEHLWTQAAARGEDDSGKMLQSIYVHCTLRYCLNFQTTQKQIVKRRHRYIFLPKIIGFNRILSTQSWNF
jgi:hypothetical protein